MELANIPHKTIVHDKLNDSQMRENLTKAMHTLQGNRLKLIENKFVDCQGLRDRARQVKNNALMSLAIVSKSSRRTPLRMAFKCTLPPLTKMPARSSIKL